ncbi:hypothetical protein J2W91_004128 [Paenibacillus amylolyticus]|uniref:DUF1433 domain-containing protein n=1 Tax=Paenibacillus amylolyticus TaxID=1451 RepID=A0AAP5H816_PAEAM|nr:hypothetical protein [Paenibacillus amylolyticus]MDR6725626.1 hypothetical protein [Paenibacillus amylolyticus]
MKKIFKISQFKTITIIFLILMLGGCNSIPNQNKIIKEASQVGHQYFIEYYNTEVEFNEHKFMPKDLSHNISLSGYVKNNKETEITILINYDTFEVQTAVVPKELLDKKIK